MSTRWLTRNRGALAILILTGVLLGLLIPAQRASRQEPIQTAGPSSSAASPGEDADAASGATRHEESERTYSRTGMARGFTIVSGPASGSVAQDFSPAGAAARLHHKPSNRYYSIVERDGRLFQRR